MKLLFTVTNDLNYDQRMIRICSTLVEDGHAVCLIGRKLNKSAPLKNADYEQKRLYCFFEKGKLFYLEYNLRLFFYLLFKQFDEICAIDLDTCLPTLAVAKIKRKKHHYDAHELFSHVPEVIGRKKVQKFWLWVERLTFRYSDSIYTVSQSISDYFELQYFRKVKVVRNMPFPDDSIIADVPELNLLPNGKFILYQGALNEGRGLELLIESILGTDYQVVLVGEGDLSGKLRNLVVEKQLQNQVKFLGFVSPEKLPAITKRAFIGYNVSENKGLSYYYSLNNKFFDYVQAELPSLINDFPEYTELLSQYQVGRLVQFSAESIREKLGELYQHEHFYALIKGNCQLAKSNWTWEKESLNLRAIYRHD